MMKNWKRTLSGLLAAITLMTAGSAMVTTASAASKTETEYSYQETYKRDNVTFSTDTKVIETKVNADADFKYTDSGLKAKLGAGATTTALKNNTSAKVGDKDANATVTGDVEVAKMSAKADFGITSKDGKTDIKAGGGAEMTALKAGGKIDANIGGVDVSAGAHVKLGIGAKAEISYKNGKLKVETGAALGAGMEFNFEVDLVKAGKALKNGAETVIKKTEEAVRDSQILKDTMRGVKDTMNKLKDCHGDSDAMTKVIADATVDAAKYVGNTVVETAKNVGSTVVETAKNAADSMIKNTVDSTKAMVEDVKKVGSAVVEGVSNAVTSAWNWVFG